MLCRLALATLLAAAPGALAGAQERPVIADYLLTIGGDTDPRTVGGHMTPSPYTGTHRLAVPLRRDQRQILGYRFFKEKRRDNALATARRAWDAFAAECAAKGGAVEDNGSPVALAFRNRVLEDVEYREAGAKHFWTGLTAVCSRGQEEVLGGLLAAVYDPTAANGPASLLLGPVPIQTAVYAYKGTAIPSLAQLRREDALADARLADQERLREREGQLINAFQTNLEVGSETSCGTVIQVRGPMAEVAVPATTTTPKGQSTFWSKRDRLFPVGRGPCVYGL